MPEQWLLTLSLMTLVAALAGAAFVIVRRIVGSPGKTADSNPLQRRMDAGLRVLTGDQPGLTTRWKHGRALLEPGRITLRPYRWGVRLLPMPALVVPVAAVVTSDPEHSGIRSALTVMPGMRLVPLSTTSGAVVQLAVLPAGADEVLRILTPEPS